MYPIFMPRKINEAAERLFSSYFVKSTLDTYGKRADRIRKGSQEEVYKSLKKLEEPDSEFVFAKLHWEDKRAARGLRLGIEEFKEKHPEYAVELEKIIKKQRKVKRDYI